MQWVQGFVAAERGVPARGTARGASAPSAPAGGMRRLAAGAGPPAATPRGVGRQPPYAEVVLRGGRSSRADDNGKELQHSLPFLIYSAPGGLRQDPGRVAESPTGT